MVKDKIHCCKIISLSLYTPRKNLPGDVYKRQTDDYTFGLFVLTPSDTYDKAAEKEATELIKSIEFFYAERVDMAMTD